MAFTGYYPFGTRSVSYTYTNSSSTTTFATGGQNYYNPYKHLTWQPVKVNPDGTIEFTSVIKKDMILDVYERWDNSSL